MQKGHTLFTSESVTEGHPDKLADQISDAVLDAMLEQDPTSRVAAETAVTTGQVFVFGEITSQAEVDLPGIIRQTIVDAGYDNDAYGINGHTCGVSISLDRQSPDIAQGVDAKKGLHKSQGAGDQGLMFGCASRKSLQYMPLPIALAHGLTKKLA